jgi:hypothetical protein
MFPSQPLNTLLYSTLRKSIMQQDKEEEEEVEGSEQRERKRN